MPNDSGAPSPVFFIVLGLGGAFWLYRLWRPAADRNRAETLYLSWMPTSMLSIAGIFLIAGRLPAPWPVVVVWSGLTLPAVFLVAGSVQKRRDRIAEKKRRAALKLVPRKRMLTRAQLITVWVVAGFVAMQGFFVVAAIITTEVVGTAPTRNASQIIAVVVMGLLAVMAISGTVHVWLHDAKLAREDERLSLLDLGHDDEPPHDEDPQHSGPRIDAPN